MLVNGAQGTWVYATPDLVDQIIKLTDHHVVSLRRDTAFEARYVEVRIFLLTYSFFIGLSIGGEQEGVFDDDGDNYNINATFSFDSKFEIST